MTRVVFMCGPAGAGKSTYARRLVEEGMTRLSIDEDAWAQGYTSHPLPDDVAVEIEQSLQARLFDEVQQGTDVVLDLSFWSRAKRDEYRRLLAPYGVIPETIYLTTPREVALQRLRERGGQHPHDVRLSETVAASHFDGFEPPTSDEGPLQVVGPDVVL